MLRNALIGILFLALGGCTEQGPDRALWQGAKDAAGAVGELFKVDAKAQAIDAPDPGETPYPNLGAMPRRPARPDAQTIAAEHDALAAQRAAAQNFDAQLRLIDPDTDPTQRPPEGQREPASVAAVPAPPPSASPIQAPPVQAPLVPAAAVAQTSPTFVPTAVPPTMVPVGPAPVAPPVRAPAPRAQTSANTAWLIGDIGFVEGSPLLTADARRVLRQAVAAAQERGGSVRVTPLVQGGAAPQEQVLAPRRMAAAAGELESLGLDRSKILVDSGVYRQARVTVEF